jgi:hypothetical protein
VPEDRGETPLASALRSYSITDSDFGIYSGWRFSEINIHLLSL